MTLAALAPAAVRRPEERGAAVLVDLRAPVVFAGGHQGGALSVPFSPRGPAQRIRVALPASTAIVLVATDDTTAEYAAAQPRRASPRGGPRATMKA